MVLTLWCGAVGGGTVWMSRYAGTPGVSAASPARWPAGWEMRPAAHGVTLVVALHPRCACSRATVRMLEQTVAAAKSPVSACILMVRPAGMDDGAEHGDLWNAASAIPGASVISDPEGRLAAQLDAHTSGQIYAFDSTGALLFSGGNTPARGHMGDSAGNDALTAILSNASTSTHRSPVFGCPLDQPAKGGK